MPVLSQMGSIPIPWFNAKNSGGTMEYVQLKNDGGRNMVKTLVILFTIQGNTNLVENRWEIYDQYVGRACTTVQTERFILAYPYNLEMSYIEKK